MSMNNTKNLFNIRQCDFQQVISYFDGNTKLIYNSLVNQIHVDLNNVSRLQSWCGFFGSEKFLKYIVPTLDGSQDELLKCYDGIIKSAIIFGNLGLVQLLIQKMCECLNIKISDINTKILLRNFECTFSLRYLCDYVSVACIHEQYHIVEYLISLGVPKVAINAGLTYACMRKNQKIMDLLISNNPDYCDNCGGRVCKYRTYKQHLPPTSIHS